MQFKLLVPTKVVVDQAASKITAEGEHGCFCLLPQHVDFLAALQPGLLIFEDDRGEEEYVAVDHGVLVKQGSEVLVSSRQATRGADLAKLRTVVRDEFSRLDDREKAAHAAAAKLEASFLRRYLELLEQPR